MRFPTHKSDIDVRMLCCSKDALSFGPSNQNIPRHFVLC